MRQTDVAKLGDGRHAAGRGLYLEVKNNGQHRSWLLRIVVDGKRKVFGLGSARILPLSMAQKKAEEFRTKIAAGIDPRQTMTVAIDTGHKFRDVAREAIVARAELSQWKNEKHAAQWVTTVETYAVPVLGAMDVADISREDVLEVLRPIWKTKAETATRLRNRLEVIFDFALRKGWRELENPAKWRGGLEFDLPARSKVLIRKHQEAPTLEESRRVAAVFWKDGTTAKLCILFGMLTAARCSEFCLTDWSEIDLNQRVWNVPPERRKDKRTYPHRVPLSTWAIELLKRLGPKESGPVFPGRIARTINSQTPRVLLARAVGRPVTMHGCRSTFRDWAAETGKDNVLAEKSLMHATGNAVEQAYQRSDLLEQRRGLMQEWADALMRFARDS